MKLKTLKTKLILVLFFVNFCFLFDGVNSIANSEITDPIDDVTDSNVDIVSVSIEGSKITIDLNDQADLSQGSSSFILLFDEDGDPSNWEATFILVIENGIGKQYWTLDDANIVDGWSDDPRSNLVFYEDNNVQISYFEYQNIVMSSMTTIGVSDSSVDWVPNERGSYMTNSVLRELIMKAKDSSYSNNLKDFTETETTTSPSTIDGFTSGIIFIVLILSLKKK